MKQLDLNVLQAMDLDVPRNILDFSVVKVPQHGSIVSHGSAVLDFTMTDLINGMVVYEVIS